VLARLRRAGLVDDRAFGRLWVENRAQFRPKSRRMLKVELRKKGLSEAEAEAVLDEAHGGDDEAAYQAATTRARRLAGLPRPEFGRKLQGFLARRGFRYETMEATIERVWREAGEPEQPPDGTGESED
jgi:regulatory protein